MAGLKRQWRASVVVIALLAGVLLLWGRKVEGHTPGDETITVATTFATLDNGVHDADPTVGVVKIDGNLTIANGGSITCNDGPPLPSTASGCDITLVVTKNLEIQAGGSINADNNINGGHGGTIDITVGGDFTMRGPGGGHPGALVTSQHKGSGTDDGGKITVVVGGVTLNKSVDPAIGICNTPNGDILIEAGATITSNSNTHRAGDIALYAGHNITVLGSVTAQGTGGTGHGGAITIDACCDLFVGDTGLVSSTGRDPGADRVHLEGCVVTIYGTVESTAPGHQLPTPNCNAPIRPGKFVAPGSTGFTACVEIWAGTTLTIDATGTHKGQVNADTGMSGGTSGGGWIDALANGAITLIGNTTTPYNTGGDINVNSLVSPPWVLHANMALQNGHGGEIAVQSTAGTVTTSGRAIQANSSTSSNGGRGGHVEVEASGNVAFGTSSIQAMGDLTGGAPQGGGIAGRSFNGTLTGGPPPGQLDAAGPGGTITLFGCLGVTYTGTSNPAFSLEVGPACGDPVVLPAPANTLLPSANCAQSCSPQTPTPTPTLTATPTRIQQLTPTPGGFCEKAAVLSVLAGRVPDKIVRTDLHQSIQDAVDNASDTNNDGFIIVGVVNNANSLLGGHTNQRVTISQVYAKPFLLFGCSVTMHDPNKGDGLPAGLITATAGSPDNIFVMDLHGADSEVAGWKVVGNGRTLRNTVGSNSATGIWFVGDNNTMHNGAASGNTGVGLSIEGNGNVATDTDAFSNGSHGVKVTGNGNQLLKIDSGEIGKGNGGDGLWVSGNGNLLSENTLRSNTHDGVRIVSGTGNTLKKNGSGGTASQDNGDCEYEVVAGNINGGENKANGILVVGSPFPTGCLGTP